MGSRQKAGDRSRLPAPSRRDVLGAAVTVPALAAASAPCPPASDDLVNQCALWLKSDFETDRLSRRWAALETLAASGYDYFCLEDHQRRRLPMGPEMDAIEVELEVLSKQRDGHFKVITDLEPRNIHDVASLLVIAARMDLYMPGDTAPLVRRSIEFLASAKCPRCGEPYVPPSLPAA